MAVTGPWPLPHHLRVPLHREQQSKGHPAFTSIDPPLLLFTLPTIQYRTLGPYPHQFRLSVLRTLQLGFSHQLHPRGRGQPATRDYRHFCAGDEPITALVSHHGVNEEPSPPGRDSKVPKL